jgi:dTDP-glucose pyrophosphorylase
MRWFNYPKLQCVILCAGKGLRFSSSEQPKTMVKIKNKPILGYIVDYWSNFTKDFIFVVGYKKEKIIDYVQKLSINKKFVEQKELKGVGDALRYAEDFVSERFIVILGDCICKGEFSFPEDMEQGIGVWRTLNSDDIKRSYSVEVKGGYVCRVVEKPKKLINDFCGMGFYFFDKRVFDYIKNTKPSKLRNEIEITDCLQNMIDVGEKITPIYFKRKYLNITYPYDLKRAYEILY